MNAQTERYVKLFRNGKNQAVRIPVEFELDGTDAIMRRGENCLIIEPAPPRALSALLASWQSLQEALPELEDPAPELVEL